MKPIHYLVATLFLFIGLMAQAQVSQSINFSVNNVTSGQVNGLDWVQLKNTTHL